MLWHWQHFAFRGQALPPGFNRADLPSYVILKLFYDHGSAAVCYFFLLSGFVFHWLYRDPIARGTLSVRRYVVHRLSRLYPLHALTLVAVAGLQYAHRAETGSPFVFFFNDGFHFVLNLGFLYGWGLEVGNAFNAPVWSVSVELVLYLAFLLLAVSGLGGALLCLTISFASFCFWLLLAKPLFNGAAMFFLGGFLFQAIRGVRPGSGRACPLVYSGAGLAWALIIVDSHVTSLSSFVLRLGLAGNVLLTAFVSYVLFPLTVASLVLMEIDKVFVAKPFAALGDLSYSSYLLHFPLQVAAAVLAGRGWIAADFHRSTVGLLTFFAVLLSLSHLSRTRFERPVQEALRRRLAFEGRDLRSIFGSGTNTAATFSGQQSSVPFQRGSVPLPAQAHRNSLAPGGQSGRVPRNVSSTAVVVSGRTERASCSSTQAVQKSPSPTAKGGTTTSWRAAPATVPRSLPRVSDCRNGDRMLDSPGDRPRSCVDVGQAGRAKREGETRGSSGSCPAGPDLGHREQEDALG